MVSAASHSIMVSVGSVGPRVRRRKRGVRAALVEARPEVTALRVNLVKGGDRTEDLQAEARAMARAANASVYNPDLLALKYGSRPIKVILAFAYLLGAIEL